MWYTPINVGGLAVENLRVTWPDTDAEQSTVDV